MESSPQGPFEVIVVGGRCAGATVAAELAGMGRRVALVDRSEFPSDAFSTHLIQANGAGYLDRVGVLDRLVEAGSPLMRRVRVCFDGVEIDERFGPAAPFGAAVSASRRILDAALLDRCRELGVEVFTRSTFQEVLWDHDRVVGVQAARRGDAFELRAPLVIGADGRQSLVAARVGARRYHVAPGERFIYWADYGGIDPGDDPAVWNVRHGAEQWLAFFSDGGRFTVAVSPPMSGYDAFMADPVVNFERAVAACAELAPIVAGARRLERPIGTAAIDAFFREPVGPGWALIGDAGLFKDPVLGQGIGDAFRQAERLAQVLGSVRPDDADAVDAALRRFGRWRDRDAAPMYWLAVDAAAGDAINELERGIFTVLASDPTLRYRFAIDVPAHWCPPSRVLSARTVIRGWGRARAQFGSTNAVLARQAAERVRRAVRRAALATSPEYRPAVATSPEGGGSS